MSMLSEALYRTWSDENLPPEERILPKEKARAVAEDLYHEAQDVLMGIPKYSRKRAEASWRGDSPNAWVNVTLPAGHNVIFETYHHPLWGVLSIDTVRIDPTNGDRRTIIDSAEVRIGTSTSPKYGQPHFSHLGIPNTEVTAASLRGFLGDLRTRVAQAA